MTWAEVFAEHNCRADSNRGIIYQFAIHTFRAHLEKLSEDELHKVITFVSQKCVVIYVATSDFDDAFRLFTIVNDREATQTH